MTQPLWPVRALAIGAAVPVLSLAAFGQRPTDKPSAGDRQISYEVNEGTWMTVDVSPDGKSIVFDLIGHLYSVPIAGGTAQPLTTGRTWYRAARFSPDGSHLSVIHDAAGPDEVWSIRLKDGDLRSLTDHSPRRFGWAAGTPSWAPDGKSIFYGEFDTDAEAGAPIRRVDVATLKVTDI